MAIEIEGPLVGKVSWHWGGSPIGHPLNPDDDDFSGPRSEPTVTLAIQYIDGGLRLQHGVMRFGRRSEFKGYEEEEMKARLTTWLTEKLAEIENAKGL